MRAAGDHPRCVVTSVAAPIPPCVSEDLDGARENGDTNLKAVTCALHRDRTSATTFLPHAMRLLLAWAASGLPHALRTQTLPQTALAQAQPSTGILPLFTVATQVQQSQERMRLPLPSACPVTALLPRVTALLSLVPLPAVNTA